MDDNSSFLNIDMSYYTVNGWNSRERFSTSVIEEVEMLHIKSNSDHFEIPKEEMPVLTPLSTVSSFSD